MEQNEKNRQKDQELTKEELEQVNGGGFLTRPKAKALWRPTDVLIAADQPRTAGEEISELQKLE